MLNKHFREKTTCRYYAQLVIFVFSVVQAEFFAISFKKKQLTKYLILEKPTF